MSEKEKKIAKIVDWLQDNTDLIHHLPEYLDDSPTESNPTSGEYALIERWILSQENVDDLLDIIKLQ